MDHRDAQLYQEIKHTRAAMTAKIDMIKAQLDVQVEEGRSTIVDGVAALLEQVNRVWEVIDNVSTTVETTVEQARKAAQKPVESKQRGIELIADVRQSPWVMIGTAVLIGYVLGAGGQLFSWGSALTERPVPEGKPERLPSPEPTDRPRSAATSAAASRIAPPTPVRTGQPANPSIYEP